MNFRFTSLVLVAITAFTFSCKHEPGEQVKPKIVEWADPPTNPREAGKYYFENDILKLMVTKCAIERLDNYTYDSDDVESGCHSSEDAQNGIVLDNHAGIKALAKDKGWKESKFYDVMVDEKKMPIPGVSADLNSEELAMLEWWVDNNAPNNAANPCEELTDSSYFVVRKILYKNCAGCHNDGLQADNPNVISFFRELPLDETYADSLNIVNSVNLILNYMERYDNPMPKHIGRLYLCEVEAIRNWSKTL